MKTSAALALIAATALWASAGCEQRRALDTAPGVSRRLAVQRAAAVSGVRYDIRFILPATPGERIEGYETLRFELAVSGDPLVLDFAAAASDVRAVRVEGRALAVNVVNDHLIIPAEALAVGDNAIEIDFLAGDGSLNRNDDYLYTLFVPDRARFAFPCFDQPDLKARYTLSLDVPGDWQAVANGPLVSRENGDGRSLLKFATTPPISTYLFSFVAGEFEVVSGQREGRLFRMYHRETDTSKIARDSATIFDLHARAIDWLEAYTGIGYPFDKFDFVLIPSFQYRGMEHPGAILYRASSLLLDESATQNELLARTALIAHETSHMWFGDLVTMEWFNDVWMKEVFANFMAAKIVNPSFPELDHQLRFLLAHYPPAYAIDRSDGANPIRQELDNLREAGTLYGAIIYQKAPIVMRQLEDLIGEDALRDGLREYLNRYASGNATWLDLISILDARTERDLAAWSRVWVEEPGRPTVTSSLDVDAAGRITTLTLTQSDPAGRGRIWNQRLGVSLFYPDSQAVVPVDLDDLSVVVQAASGAAAPDFVLPNGRGFGYGLFALDESSLEYLLENVHALPAALTRGSVWLTLWEAMLEERVSPARIVEVATNALSLESDPQLVERILAYLSVAYWRFLPDSLRSAYAPRLESLLWDRARTAETSSLQAAYFDALQTVALSEASVRRLESIWRQQVNVPGLKLSETDYTRLALELAVREVRGWSSILEEQAARIENPDRRDRFEFVRPAVNADPAVRDSFFETLKSPTHREHEPWVLEALGYLHHPLRAARSEKYIRPSLELLEEIQITGDIFFPKGWLDATLEGHRSPQAAAIVRTFLQAHPDLPPRLRAKVLQSADMLFRSSAILSSSR